MFGFYTNVFLTRLDPRDIIIDKMRQFYFDLETIKNHLDEPDNLVKLISLIEEWKPRKLAKLIDIYNHTRYGHYKAQNITNFRTALDQFQWRNFCVAHQQGATFNLQELNEFVVRLQGIIGQISSDERPNPIPAGHKYTPWPA